MMMLVDGSCWSISMTGYSSLFFQGWTYEAEIYITIMQELWDTLHEVLLFCVWRVFYLASSLLAWWIWACTFIKLFIFQGLDLSLQAWCITDWTVWRMYRLCVKTAAFLGCRELCSFQRLYVVFKVISKHFCIQILWNIPSFHH